MAATADTFNTSMPVWLAEQQTPWGRLKYTVVRTNLCRHLEPGPLHILDAGGGNGFDSIPFAAVGHRVTIVDYSAEMLADAERNATAAEVEAQVILHHAELTTLPELFPDPLFDVVLCHNVLQHVDDLRALLAAVVAPLKSGGILSMMSVNRYAIPYRAAFMRGELADAYAKLDQREEVATLFGTRTQEYAPEELVALLSELGCVVEQHYGIRCICDYWGDNERKSDPEVFAQLEKLELALSDRYPYKLLARYFQIVARKR